MQKTHVYIDLSRLCLTSFTTGIQRVAKAIVLRMLENPKLEVTLLADLPSHTEWRILPHDAFTEYYTAHTGSPYGTGKMQKLAPQDIAPDSIFFDIDSAWNMPMHRGWLFPILKQRGVTIVSHLYDLIPVTHPQFFYELTVTQFLSWTSSVLQYADHIICNAEATKDALADLCKSLDIAPPPCTVVPLGADFAPKKQAADAEDEEEEKDTELLEKLVPRRYLLMVGTIEPRKNHALLLDAVDELSALGVKVVFAGRIGWNMAEFEKRMEHHPKAGTDFFFANSPTDATISALYENALAIAFPTKNEGFGLPIVEAFQHGTPVLASDIPVLREVGGELADYFDNTSVESLVAAVKKLLDNPDAYAEKTKQLAEYQPRTWDIAAQEMGDALCRVSESAEQLPDALTVKQMVVLTARNEDLLRSLPYWDAYLPFIEELLIVCPSKNNAELQEKWQGRIKLSFFNDEQLLEGNPLPEDHTMRNFYLRCLLMQKAPLDDVFIMTDDDYRPLLPLTQEIFLKDNRYQAYYCYDLKEWKGTQCSYTSYDESMFRTRDWLLGEHFPTLQYSSHQPQIIDRRIYLEMLGEYPEIQSQGLDEWSTYFNFAIAKHAGKFYALPYCSMAWPGAITDWKLWCQPSHFYFENFYDVLYEDGRVFEGMATTFDAEKTPAENMEKVMRWTRELDCQRAENAANSVFTTLHHRLYRTLPQFVLRVDGAGNPSFAVPQVLYFCAGGQMRVSVHTDKELRQGDAVLRCQLLKVDGKPLTPMQEIPLAEVNADLPPELVLTLPQFACTGMLRIEYVRQPIADAEEPTEPDAAAEISCVLV